MPPTEPIPHLATVRPGCGKKEAGTAVALAELGERVRRSPAALEVPYGRLVEWCSDEVEPEDINSQESGEWGMCGSFGTPRSQ